MNRLLLCMTLFSLSSFASTDDYRTNSLKPKSQIKKVTTYSDKAQITRKTQIENRKSGWVKIGPLPYNLKKESIRASVSGSYSLERVVIEDSYEKINLNDEVESNLKKLNSLYAKKLELIQEQALTNKKYKFTRNLYFNAPVGNQNQNYVAFKSSMKNLTSAFETIMNQSSKSYGDILKLNSKMRDLNQEIDFIQRWLGDKTSTQNQNWVTYTYLYLKKNKKGKANIELSYIVPNASWKPIYDLRAKLNIRDGLVEIDLITSGLIKQNTKEDWKEIDITLSTLDPYPLILPQFTRWTFKERREEVLEESFNEDEMDMDSKMAFRGVKMKRSPSPEAKRTKQASKKNMRLSKSNGVMKESTAMDAMMTSRSRPSTSFGDPAQKISSANRQIEKNSSVSFPLKRLEVYFNEYRQIKKRISSLANTKIQYQPYIYSRNQKKYQRNNYSNSKLPAVTAKGRKIELRSPFKLNLKSDNDEIKIPLRSQSFIGQISYFIIPKKDKRAFIKAKIVNRTNSMILAGKAHIFMDGDLVSKTNLSTVAENSHFEIDLGIDQNVETKRIVKKKSQEKGFILMKEHSTQVSVEIQIVNHNNFPIKVDLRDNYPQSPGKEIKVEFGEMNFKSRYHKFGVLYWDREIPAKGKDTIIFSYQVTHPKNYLVSEFN
jgi:hypothetical protein